MKAVQPDEAMCSKSGSKQEQGKKIKLSKAGKQAKARDKRDSGVGTEQEAGRLRGC